jgi:hypothetical protein
VMFFQQQAPLAETEGSPASFPRCWSPCRDLKAERHSVPHKPRSRLASLGLPALHASDPGRSHRERVGSGCMERPLLAQGSEAAAHAAIAALFVAPSSSNALLAI